MKLIRLIYLYLTHKPVDRAAAKQGIRNIKDIPRGEIMDIWC